MVFEKLQPILAELFSVEAEDITAETDFYNDLFADSLDMFELWLILEEEFDLRDSDRKNMENFKIVDQIVEYLG